jgi:hypothetical protein
MHVREPETQSNMFGKRARGEGVYKFLVNALSLWVPGTAFCPWHWSAWPPDFPAQRCPLLPLALAPGVSPFGRKISLPSLAARCPWLLPPWCLPLAFRLAARFSYPGMSLVAPGIAPTVGRRLQSKALLRVTRQSNILKNTWGGQNRARRQRPNNNSGI